MSPQSDRSTIRFIRVSRILNAILVPVYLLALTSLVLEYGYRLDPWWQHINRMSQIGAVLYFMFQQSVKALLAPNRGELMHDRRVEYAASTILIASIVLTQVLAGMGLELPGILASRNLFALYIVLLQIVILVEVIASAIRYSQRIAMLQIQPARLFIASFILVILTGTAVLMLPKATHHGVRFIDALFTSTSAVCVTGLIAVDTPTTFTRMGQVTIMLLIQVGGLGLMTFTTFYTLFSGRLSIKERVLMQEFLSKDSIGEIRQTLIQIIALTLGIELLGALILFLSWDAGCFTTLDDKIFSSVFHAVSGFCNAGFSTFSLNLADPRLSSDPGIIVTIGMLIIFGGLGFMVIMNLLSMRPFSSRPRRLQQRLSVHSRIVIVMTLLLVFGGMFSIWLFERGTTMRSLSFGEQMLTSFFQSVTCRTAGFNSMDLSVISMPTVLIMTTLMFIGASPASTGGGIKTTTFTLLLLSSLSLVRGTSKVEIGRRQVSASSIERAYATLTLSLALVFFAVMIVTFVEPFQLGDVIYECVSAFGTVGLSRGITPYLTDVSKLTLIVTMLIGRVGAITMVMALTRPVTTADYDYPSENILI